MTLEMAVRLVGFHTRAEATGSYETNANDLYERISRNDQYRNVWRLGTEWQWYKARLQVMDAYMTISILGSE